jgi:hypothetical protein
MADGRWQMKSPIVGSDRAVCIKPVGFLLTLRRDLMIDYKSVSPSQPADKTRQVFQSMNSGESDIR